MRIVLWILLLLGLFAAVTMYHDRVLEAARSDRDAARGKVERAPADLPPGWGRAIVGAKSGVEPIEADVPPVVPDGPTPHGSDAGPGGVEHAGEAERPGESEHIVQRGESLSTICRARYGTARNDLVTALARYNKLEDAGSIREGQKLALPPLAILRPKR